MEQRAQSHACMGSAESRHQSTESQLMEQRAQSRACSSIAESRHQSMKSIDGNQPMKSTEINN
jgi:hypothetical protein